MCSLDNIYDEWLADYHAKNGRAPSESVIKICKKIVTSCKKMYSIGKEDRENNSDPSYDLLTEVAACVYTDEPELNKAIIDLLSKFYWDGWDDGGGK